MCDKVVILLRRCILGLRGESLIPAVSFSGTISHGLCVGILFGAVQARFLHARRVNVLVAPVVQYHDGKHLGVYLDVLLSC